MLVHFKGALFAALVICLAAFLCVAGCRKSNSAAQREQIRNARIGNSLQKSGALSKDEYLRIVQLDAAVSSGSALPETDADWLLSLSGRPGTPYQKGIRLLHASTVFKHGKAPQFPVSRHQKIFDMAVQMLPYKSDVVTTAVPFSGCMVLGNLEDAKAIPILQKMLDSPYSEVRETAQHSIDRITGAAKQSAAKGRQK